VKAAIHQEPARADLPLMDGKTVLVTGATGGIGKATAVGLARMGARVGITGRDIARAEAAATDIRVLANNASVDAFAADLSSQAEVRRLQGSGVTATVLHPGVVSTAFGAEDQSVFFRLMLPLMRPFMKTTAQGAATSIYLASSPQVEGVTGRYFSNSKPRKSSKSSYDSAAARRLWRVSTDLVGLTTADAVRHAGLLDGTTSGAFRRRVRRRNGVHSAPAATGSDRSPAVASLPASATRASDVVVPRCSRPRIHGRQT
jgi:short chain dehydrogenase